MASENTSYDWLFTGKVALTSGDLCLELEHVPLILRPIVIQLLLNQIDLDTAEKKVAELIQLLEFDITAAELSANLFKPGHYYRLPAKR